MDTEPSRRTRQAKQLFYLAAFLSLVLSVALYFLVDGGETDGIFVGIWVPSILSLGCLMFAGERAQ
ncbi:MAG: hypothetical protein ACKOA9_03005 [Actinomycetota bacterium]